MCWRKKNLLWSMIHLWKMTHPGSMTHGQDHVHRRLWNCRLGHGFRPAVAHMDRPLCQVSRFHHIHPVAAEVSYMGYPQWTP